MAIIYNDQGHIIGSHNAKNGIDLLKSMIDH